MGTHTSTLYIDIETIPSEVRPDPTTLKAPANYSKPEVIAKWQEENAEDAYRKQSFDPYQGRILCIGVAINDEEPFVITGPESVIMLKLNDLIKTVPSIDKVVAHNGLDFDYFFLFVKSIKYKYPSLRRLFDGSQKFMLVDTMKLAAGPKWGEKTSLNKLATLIGVEGKGDMDGSKVWDYHLAGRDEEIYEYCKHDVEVLRSIYKRLTE